jgi:MFS transporter, MHS family, shikimate and dehydroshikimate transport protein
MTSEVTQPLPPPSMRKNVLVSLAGSAIEWYDFSIYASAAALAFNKLFFSSVNPVVGTLLAFSTFAVGFLVRPLGAVVFGHFGDRFGRKGTLIVAMMTMGLATTAVGLLPTYAAVGVLAPVLLVVLRLIQGLALGGQWGGAVLLVTENAPREKRGYYGSFAQLGVPIALILSTLVFLLSGAFMSQQAFLSWGWRVPFLLSILLVVVGLYAQSRIQDTTSMKALRESAAPTRRPFLELVRTHPKQIALVAGATIINGAFYYTVAVYMLSYATQQLHMRRDVLLVGLLVSALFYTIAIPMAGALSDRIGRRRVFMVGALLQAVWVFPLFVLIDSRSELLIGIALVIAQITNSLTYGPVSALFSEMFSVQVRYSGVSVGYQIGAILGGAFAPIIATALYGAFRSTYPIAAYVAAMALLSLLSVFLTAETSRSALPTKHVPSLV